MCMLTYFDPGAQPDTVALLNGAETNNDGHGFAIITRHAANPIVRRFLDPEIAVSEFVRLRDQFSDGPALFHSRFGTAGAYGMFNVHPFRIDKRTVVAHNGVLPRSMQPGKKDQRCDTRLFAEDMLRDYNLSDPKVRNDIADIIGGGNKLVILSTREDYDPAYIVNEDQGHWEEGGIWYSNLDYTGWWSHKPTTLETEGDDGFSWLGADGKRVYVIGGKMYEGSYTTPLCNACGSDEMDFKSEVCLSCDACQDCGLNYWDGECQCYVKTRWEGVAS